jgi:hypothetical protein
MATFTNGVFLNVPAWTKAGDHRLARKVDKTGWNTNVANYAPRFKSDTNLFGTSGDFSVRNVRRAWNAWVQGRNGIRNIFATAHGGIKRGNATMAGHTYESGVAVARRVMIFTKSPNPQFVGEAETTVAGGGVFSIPGLAPGTYTAIDYDPTGANRAQIYDWIVVS